MSITYPFRGGTTTLSSLGNSLLAVYPNYDKTVDGPGQSYFGPSAFQEIGNALADSPAFQRGSAATGGYLVQEIIDVHLPTIMNLRPALCLVDGGGNNIGSDENTDAALVGLEYIYEQLVAAGIQPIAMTLPQLGISDPVVAARIQRVNSFVQGYALVHGLPVLDLTSILTDPNTGTYPTGWTTDGEHPNGVGTRAIARAFAELLRKLLPDSDGAVYLSVNAELDYAARNPLLQADTGDATLPAWFQLYPSTTHSLTAGDVGNEFSWTAPDSDSYVLYGPGVDVQPGDEIVMAVRITTEVEAVADGSFDVALIGADMGTGIAAGYGWQTDLTDNVIVYHAFVAANSPDATARAQFKVQGAGAKITVSQVTVRNLTASREQR